MVFGDRNTSFYHMSALARRKRNRISTIKNSAGEWLIEEAEVMEHIRKGFESLYTTSHLSSAVGLLKPSRWQATLSDTEKEAIKAEVSNEEIKVALWSFKASKASGPDGL